MNLCKLPKEEYEAMQQDKERWHKCYVMLKEWGRPQIKWWLETQCEESSVEDFKRRLNLLNSRK
jgi:hypothetical protein